MSLCGALEPEGEHVLWRCLALEHVRNQQLIKITEKMEAPALLGVLRPSRDTQMFADHREEAEVADVQCSSLVVFRCSSLADVRC